MERRKKRKKANLRSFQTSSPLSLTNHFGHHGGNGDHHDSILRSSVENSTLFGPSAAKRHRVNGPSADSAASATASPAASPSPTHESLMSRWGGGNASSAASAHNSSGERENNNKPPQSESLLSQALEKAPNPASHPHYPHPAVLRNINELTHGSSDGGRGGNGGVDDSASDTASDKPESLMDGLIKAGDPESLQRHLSSPAGNPVNPLFPPGLEALYRQAGFPSAFLGLAAGGAGAPPGLPVSSSSSLPGMPSGPPVGLQSHAGNPSRKSLIPFPNGSNQGLNQGDGCP